MNAKEIPSFIKQTFRAYKNDNAPNLGAALAYYTVFSLAPILIIVMAVIGFFFGEEASRGEVFRELNGFLGVESAGQVQKIVENVSQSDRKGIASILSVLGVILGATGVFTVLKDSLNTVWEMKATPKNGIWHFIRTRILSFAIIVSIGFILLVALVVSAGVTALGNSLAGVIPGMSEVILEIINIVLSVGVSTLMFAIIFKTIPDAKIKWSDVWIGALFTALLFGLGKFLIGLYLGKSGVTETYGAAGAVVLILLWTYYSAQILFLGAEMTYVYAKEYGSGIVPSKDAKKVIRKEVEETDAPSWLDRIRHPFSPRKHHRA